MLRCRPSAALLPFLVHTLLIPSVTCGCCDISPAPASEPLLPSTPTLAMLAYRRAAGVAAGSSAMRSGFTRSPLSHSLLTESTTFLRPSPQRFLVTGASACVSPLSIFSLPGPQETTPHLSARPPSGHRAGGGGRSHSTSSTSSSALRFPGPLSASPPLPSSPPPCSSPPPPPPTPRPSTSPLSPSSPTPCPPL